MTCSQCCASWVIACGCPGRSWWEFWRNRESVLQDPRDTGKTVRELADLATKAVDAFRAWANRVGLPEQRSQELSAVLADAFAAVTAGVSELSDEDASQFAADTAKDPVLAGLEPILRDRVGLAFDDAEYQKALAEAKRRADAKEPPGYKDVGKPGVGQAGDYLIWAQILKEAACRRQDVLIVTGDVKEDWWRRERGQHRGPRPELAEELRKIAGTRLFMLRPVSLLLHARQVLQVQVRDESVQDIERVAEAEDAADPREMLERLMGYGHASCLESIYEGLLELGYQPKVPDTRVPGRLPEPYLSWFDPARGGPTVIRFTAEKLWFIRREDLRPLADLSGGRTEDDGGRQHNVSFPMRDEHVPAILDGARRLKR